MSCCAKQPSNLKKPLVANDSLQQPNSKISGASGNYGTSNDIQPKIPTFSSFASLLDPSGQLSEELINVLDEIFMKYSNGLLIMTKECLIRYYQNCYPNLSQEKYYDERAQYILNKYGKKVNEIKEQLTNVLNKNKDSTSTKQEIIDTYSPHTNRRKQQNTNKEDIEETKYDNNNNNNKTDNNNNEEEKKDENINNKIIKSKHHSIAIKEDKSIIDSTINCDIDSSEIVLLKTKFLLLYRKSCVDKPMMVRLELTELGYEQFRSGMIIDRTKQLDKLAFNIQQLRNRYNTHLEERKRIDNASSPNECAINIESFIQNNKEPLDFPNDPTNLFRKRRPIKFPKICHMCCCCCVACIRCCE